MIPGSLPGSKEIIRLLSKLKAATPEYPVGMLAARKAAFIKHISFLPGRMGGKGGGSGQAGGGGAGTTLSGSAGASGVTLQTVLGLGLLVVILAGANFIRDKVIDLFEKDIVVATTESPVLPVFTEAGTFATQEATPLPPGISRTVVTPTAEPTRTRHTPLVEPNNILAENETHGSSNPGLHLGQTPGAPAAPGQGNPGNINQPEKPEKQKPGKSRESEKSKINR
jgi:hypothetical protein